MFTLNTHIKFSKVYAHLGGVLFATVIREVMVSIAHFVFGQSAKPVENEPATITICRHGLHILERLGMQCLVILSVV